MNVSVSLARGNSRAKDLNPSERITRAKVGISARVSFFAHASRLLKHRSCREEYCCSIRSISSFVKVNPRAICFQILRHSSRWQIRLNGTRKNFNWSKTNRSDESLFSLVVLYLRSSRFSALDAVRLSNVEDLGPNPIGWCRPRLESGSTVYRRSEECVWTRRTACSTAHRLRSHVRSLRDGCVWFPADVPSDAIRHRQDSHWCRGRGPESKFLKESIRGEEEKTRDAPSLGNVAKVFEWTERCSSGTFGSRIINSAKQTSVSTHSCFTYDERQAENK